MGQRRSLLFRGRHFRDEVIVLCLRWYLRYPLSYRDLEEMMMERGLTVDHSTIARWVLRYASVLNERIRSEMRQPNRSWRADALDGEAPSCRVLESVHEFVAGRPISDDLTLLVADL